MNYIDRPTKKVNRYLACDNCFVIMEKIDMVFDKCSMGRVEMYSGCPTYTYRCPQCFDTVVTRVSYPEKVDVEI